MNCDESTDVMELALVSLRTSSWFLLIISALICFFRGGLWIIKEAAVSWLNRLIFHIRMIVCVCVCVLMMNGNNH